MKQQTATNMDILPQLDKACGLDIHKEKIVGFIACKDGSGQELLRVRIASIVFWWDMNFECDNIKFRWGGSCSAIPGFGDFEEWLYDSHPKLFRKSAPRDVFARAGCVRRP